jgi:hypothetical protein
MDLNPEIFDIWSIGHFLSGFFLSLTIWPNNIFYSIIISNIIHIFAEYVENFEDPDGYVLQTLKNKISDVVFFLIGSILSIPFVIYFQNNKNIVLRYILIIIFLVIGIQEIGKEIFPYSWFYSPAFNAYNKRKQS